MARRSRSPKVKKVGGTSVIMVPSPAAAPVRRRRSRGGIARRRSGGVRRRRRSSGAGSLLSFGGGYTSRMVGHGVGGFAVGFLEKTFPNIPTLPLVGRKGAIALAAAFLHRKHPLIADVGLAAAAISGYELGSQGHITGDVMGGTIASQM